MCICVCVCVCSCTSVYAICPPLLHYIHKYADIHIYDKIHMNYMNDWPVIGKLQPRIHCNTMDTLQHIATRYNTLQHTATHCNTLQHTATQTCRTEPLSDGESAHCNTLQHTATHCNVLQHTAIHCNTLQHLISADHSCTFIATYCNTLKFTATHGNPL